MKFDWTLVGVLAVTSILWQAAGTFTLAYLFGYALPVGPLMQEGVGFKIAVMDAFYSETPSITIVEITAIGTDLLIAGDAEFGSLLFWSALAFSLSVGFVFVFPVNVVLIPLGVEEGMMNPAEMGQGNRGNAQAAD